MEEGRMKAELSAVRLLATSAAVAALVSCGGGGGSSSSGGGAPAVPSAPLVLTSANAQNVAGDATLAAIGASSNGGGLFLAADTRSSSVRPKTHVLSRLLMQEIDRLNLQSPSIIAAVVQTFPCAFGGSRSEDATQNSATVTFNNCSEATGESISGSIAISNITGAATSFSASVSVNLTFSATGFPDESFTGSFTMSLSTVGAVTTITLSGGEILTHTGTNFERLSSFTLVSSSDSSSLVRTDSVTLTYASTEIGGSVTITTTKPFETIDGRTFPHAGAILIVGASGGKIRVTVLGDETLPAPQVRIELDADGDDTFETTLDRNWSDLTA